MRFIATLVVTLFIMTSYAQEKFSWQRHPSGNSITLLYNGSPLTSYCKFDSVEKPVLFPIKTVKGTEITRGYPMSPRPGERTDHPHHVGLWLNYESVNGLDFWNNSTAIAADRKHLYGSIQLVRINSSLTGSDGATLNALSQWVDSNGKVLLDETTNFKFTVDGTTFIIDRSSSLSAVADEVIFRDVKDGMLGLRVARQLELPSKQEDKFVDAKGNITTVPLISNEGVTGMYVNREGLRGDDVWGKRSAWTYLTGKIENEVITIGIIDHPSNPGYPTYWHARGYGLFAANPLGQKVFSNGKEELNFSLRKGESVEFKYRVIIHSGSELSRNQMDKFMNDFAASED
jgi:hypothetical protein